MVPLKLFHSLAVLSGYIVILPEKNKQKLDIGSSPMLNKNNFTFSEYDY